MSLSLSLQNDKFYRTYVVRSSFGIEEWLALAFNILYANPQTQITFESHLKISTLRLNWTKGRKRKKTHTHTKTDSKSHSFHWSQFKLNIPFTNHTNRTFYTDHCVCVYPILRNNLRLDAKDKCVCAFSFSAPIRVRERERERIAKKFDQ